MKIESVILREIRMRLKSPFETSFGVTQQRRIILVEILSEGLRGWGEVTAGETPGYNPETTDTAWQVISDFVIPRVLGANVSSASEFPALVASIRGHEMAKAGVECALWDIEAQAKKLPLSALVGGSREEIACGVSLGIRENPGALVDKVGEEVKAGYQRIKLKIKPDKDLEFVAAVRRHFPNILLSVDGNSAYRIEDAEHLRRLDEYKLLMIEQPLQWDEIFAHGTLQKRIETAVCLDECITNERHASTAIEIGACRIVNIKLGRVGGFTEALKVHSVCLKNSIPVWCGGMLESGIGRAHNIAMSTLEGFSLPGDVSASARYWEQDIIDPEVTVTPRGTIRVPIEPGLGYNVRRDLIEDLTVRREDFAGARQTGNR